MASHIRKFGTELSVNARTPDDKRKNLTVAERAAIIAARTVGTPRRELAAFDCMLGTKSNAGNTVKRWQDRQTLQSLPRSGRPQY